ncbi:nuclear speckle splicing regulatory protein 1 [Cotesia glomerata]|uniref:Nuclear speckle splicing regulatory protein 1 N-terminal domain-containing protein n=1 Tax=Cotesia glomerata TaxID=32391 RepID=A0AAV7IB21_COTGL|nr:nuclear speckle splicing regulatory protein 1 [Cotesia glomerata]KAH0548863.1 hypothetical protein KQX54_003488 [Cotesia glomerata]
MNPNNRKYGLDVQKKELSAPKSGNVFGDEDSDEEAIGANWVGKTIKAEAEKNRSKKQTKLNVQRALEVDPTIFQYDEIYDDMSSSKKVKEVSAKKQDLKPKYIHNLKEAAEKRKRENECRIERKVQKEREAEGDMYKDKEVFVTETHRRNLEKMMQLHEDEERMDRLEAIADVTKQPDISGFYRHLYSQTIDKKPIKEEKDSAAEERADTSESAVNIDRDEDLSVDSDSSERSQSNSESGSEKSGGSKKLEPKKSFAKRKRQYRSRNVEDSEDESEIKGKVKKSEKKKPRAEAEDQTDAEDEAEAESQIEEKKDEVEKDSVEEKGTDDSKKDEVKVEEEKILEVVKEEKPKVSIWEKRTVGDVFDAALQRYYTRKALRMSS